MRRNPLRNTPLFEAGDPLRHFSQEPLPKRGESPRQVNRAPVWEPQALANYKRSVERGATAQTIVPPSAYVAAPAAEAAAPAPRSEQEVAHAFNQALITALTATFPRTAEPGYRQNAHRAWVGMLEDLPLDRRWKLNVHDLTDLPFRKHFRGHAENPADQVNQFTGELEQCYRRVVRDFPRAQARGDAAEYAAAAPSSASFVDSVTRDTRSDTQKVAAFVESFATQVRHAFPSDSQPGYGHNAWRARVATMAHLSTGPNQRMILREDLVDLPIQKFFAFDQAGLQGDKQLQHFNDTLNQCYDRALKYANIGQEPRQTREEQEPYLRILRLASAGGFER